VPDSYSNAYADSVYLLLIKYSSTALFMSYIYD